MKKKVDGESCHWPFLANQTIRVVGTLDATLHRLCDLRSKK